jgi:leucine dehydrogenase
MDTAMSPNVFPYPVPREIKDHSKLGIFDHAAMHGMEDLHFKVDPISGLKAIIAIHSTRKGSALGGTRCLKYPSEHHALEDAMRLAQGMSYKSAFAGLPYGGGKGVLLRPDKITNPDAYFESYGEFIDSFNGRFITAVDVGTKVSDMDIIVRKTKFVLSTSAASGDPSLHTAQGVLKAINAAIKVKLDRSDLEDILVAIQGIYHLVHSAALLMTRQYTASEQKLSVVQPIINWLKMSTVMFYFRKTFFTYRTMSLMWVA